MSKRFYLRSLLTISLLAYTFTYLQSQNVDCDKAIVICSDDTFLNFNSRDGGIDDFENPNNNAGCLDFQTPGGNIVRFREMAAGWFYLEFRDDMPPNSVLEFSIMPRLINANDVSDYDFAIYGPNLSCDSLGSPIRCSFVNGDCEFCPDTGLGMGEVDTSEASWDPEMIDNTNGFVKPMVVQPGEVYYLFLEYFEGDVPPDQSNIDIDWGGSAAPFLNCVANPFCELATVEAFGDTTICPGNSIPISGFATNTNGGESYSWSGTQGATAWVKDVNSPNTTVNIPADFEGGEVQFVLLAKEGNCEKFDTVTVNINPLPDVSIEAPEVGCKGDTLTLTATPGFESYQWNTGATTNSIEVSEKGDYSVTVTNALGCQRVVSYFAQFVELPNPLIMGEDIFCNGETVRLDAGEGLSSYLWSDGSTERFLDVTKPGNYAVTVMTELGNCVVSDSIIISQYPISTVQITGDLLLCPDEITTLSVPDTFRSYSWSVGGTGAAVTVDLAQEISVTVEDDNECPVVDTVSLTALDAPIPEIPTDTLFCQNDSVLIDARAGFDTYLWSDGSSAASIWIAQAGAVSVTVTDVLGCEGTAQLQANTFQQPQSGLPDSTGFCAGSSVELIASNDDIVSYQWNTGQVTASINVNSGGWYYLTFTDVNGCVGEDSVFVAVYQIPTPDILGQATICDGEEALLIGEDGFVTYQWSTGDNLQQISTLQADTYILTVEDENGCRGNNSIEVNVQNLPEPIVEGPTIFCPGDTATLAVSTSFDNYQWSTSSTAQNITVTEQGRFSVTVTDDNGCKGSTAFDIDQHTQPQPQIGGIFAFCENDSVLLRVSDSFVNFDWSNGANTPEIIVKDGGPVRITVTDDRGCRGFDTVVLVKNALPEVLIEGRDEICSYEEETLSLNNTFVSYQWQDGSTENTFMANQTGNYRVEVEDENGCAAIDSFFLQVNEAPVPKILGDSTFCSEDTLILQADREYLAYQWNTGFTSPTTIAFLGGTYVLSVLDSNGCRGSASKLVIQFSLPEPFIQGPEEFCEGDTAELAVNRDFPDFSWNNGATTRSISVEEGGEYRVTVTDVRGCQNDTVWRLTQNALPEVSITGPEEICSNEVAEFTATTGFDSYIWQDGSTSTVFSSNQAGRYSVTVTDDKACQNSDAINLAVNPIPEPIIRGDSSFCLGDSIFLDAFDSSYASYSWNTGEITSIIRIGDGGTFTVTVTDFNSCQGVDTFEVERKDAPVPIILGDDEFCDGASVQLEVEQDFLSYKWSDGSTGKRIVVDSGGYYTVRVMDGTECEGIGRTTVVQNPNPVPEISGDSIICDYETAELVGQPGFDDYRWSNSVRGPEVSISDPGIYTLAVVDSNGCEGQNNIEIIVNNSPVPEILSDTVFCEGDELPMTLNEPFAERIWSMGDSTVVISVTEGGIYKVLVTDENGCRASTEQAITRTPQPRPVIEGPVEFCTGGQVTLSADRTYQTYRWSTGDTTATIAVSQGGVYALTVTDETGCDGSASFTLIENQLPVPEISGDSNICVNERAILIAEPGFVNYEWSDGSTEPVLQTNNPGAYTVTVTDGNGCSGAMSRTVVVNELPTPRLEDIIQFCEEDTLFIKTLEPYTAYEWSTGSTADSLGVFAAGDYAVTVTDTNGCIGATPVQSIVEVERPRPRIQGLDEICESDRSALSTFERYESYRWSTGEEDIAITIESGGIYEVTVTNENGCTGSDQINITEHPDPVPQISGPAAICADTFASLSVSLNYDQYQWSTGQTLPAELVTDPGTYTITVTDQNGCRGTDSFNLQVNELPIPEIEGGNGFCNSDTLRLNIVQDYDIINWSTGDVTQGIILTAPGMYGLTVTDQNGCTNDTTLNILEDVVPTPNISGNLFFCENGETLLEADDNFATYQWSTGDTTVGIQVNSPGTYSVTVTDVNGCEGEESVFVREVQNPVPRFEGDKDFCKNESTNIIVRQEYLSYLWSTGETRRAITIDQAGTYEVSVVDENGCQGSSSLEITEQALPQPEILGEQAFCEGDTINISADRSYPSVQWNTGAETTSITVTQGNIYRLTVTDENGCVGDTSRQIIQYSRPRPQITGQTVFCQGNRSLLEVSRGFVDYQWSSGQGNRQITVAQSGIYEITVTDGRGCTGTDNIEVNVLDNPEPEIVGDTSICVGQSTQLTVDKDYVAIFWDNGEEEDTIVIDRSRDVGVIVFDENGCSASTSRRVNEFNLPDPQIAGARKFCIGDTVILAVEEYEAYSWSNGATESFTGITSPGRYIVTVTNEFECSAATSITIEAYEEPVVEVEGDGFYCENRFTELQATQGFEEYQWSSGETVPRIFVNQPGIYTLEVTDENGCRATAEREVLEIELPEPIIEGPPILCDNDTAVLSVPDVYATYAWSGSRDSLPTSTITDGGIYRLQVTDAFGCIGDDTISVTSLVSPQINVSGAVEFCPGDSILLQVSPDNYEFSWNDGDSTVQKIVKTGGLYQVTAVAENGCTTTLEQPVDERPSPEFAVLGQRSFCSGSSTTLTVEGREDYTYQWPNGSRASSIEISNGGQYVLTVTNSSGCEKVDTINIEELSIRTPILPSRASVCTGDTLVLNAGNNYQAYSWNTGSREAFILVDSGGYYEVELTDFNGCIASIGTQVEEVTATEPLILGPGTLCSGQRTPLFVQGGFTEFQWSNGDTTQAIDVSQEGFYRITVTDQNGCVRETGKLVVEVPSPDVKLIGDTTFCEDGTTTLTVETNAPQIEWSTGATGNSIVVDEERIYGVLVRGANGCRVVEEILVKEKQNPQPVISGDAVACFEEGAQLDAGAEFLSYTWSTGDRTQVINVGNTGNYRVEVVDSFGCRGMADFDVAINPSPEPTIIGKPKLCPDETIVLSLREGFQQYEWSNGSDSSAIQVDQVQTVSVRVWDRNGCTADDTFQVTAGVTPTVDIVGDSFLCIGSSVVIGVRDTFETYEWSNGRGGRSIEIFDAGTYRITVSNEDGCFAEDSVTIATAQPPVADAGADIVTDCNTAEVLLDATGSSRGDRYVYEWTGPGIPNIQRGLRPRVRIPGLYRLTVVDTTTGCVSVPDEVTVSSNSESPVGQASVQGVLTCDIDSVQLLASSSNSPQAIVRWQNPQGGTLSTTNTGQAWATSPGTYIAIFTDTITGCLSTQEVEVSINNTPPVADAGDNTYLDCNTLQTRLDASGSDLGQSFELMWRSQDGHELAEPDVVNPIVTQPGIYELSIRRLGNGCISTDQVEVLVDTLLPVANAGPDQLIDCADLVVELDGSQSSAAGEAVLSWTSPDYPDFISLQATPSVAREGTYILTVEDLQNGCLATDTVEVSSSNNGLEVTYNINRPVCFGEDNAWISIGEVRGGSGPYLHSLDFEPYSSVDSFTNLTAGKYIIVTQDINGCENFDTLTIPQGRLLGVDLGPDQTIKAGNSAMINPQLFEITPSEVFRVDWKPEEHLNCMDIGCLQGAVVTPEQTTEYSIEIEDQFGCIARDSVIIAVDDTFRIYIPNVFSPNGDGVNDKFTFDIGPRVERVTYFRVFGRWGGMLFERINFSPRPLFVGWDGTYNGKLMNAGVYVYILALELEDGTVVYRSGDITLVR